MLPDVKKEGRAVQVSPSRQRSARNAVPMPCCCLSLPKQKTRVCLCEVDVWQGT